MPYIVVSKKYCDAKKELGLLVVVGEGYSNYLRRLGHCLPLSQQNKKEKKSIGDDELFESYS